MMYFFSIKHLWKSLQNGCHFVQASICWCCALPNTVFPDPNAHTHAHSAATVKLASPHWDSTYWPRKPIFLNLKTRHKHLWSAQWPSLFSPCDLEIGQFSIDHNVLSQNCNSFFFSTGIWFVAYVDRLLRLVSLMANICTVPLSLDTHRKLESWLKLILKQNMSQLHIMQHVTLASVSLKINLMKFSKSPQTAFPIPYHWGFGIL